MYKKLASLRLEITGVELLPLEQKTANFIRKTTVIKLHGRGQSGCGEDVTYEPEDQEVFQKTSNIDIKGKYTLESFSNHLSTIELWPKPPKRETSKNFRIWALESAALSLALKQNDATLAGLLGIRLEPLNFVASMGLGDPPSVEPLRKLKGMHPNLRFKIDTSSKWTEELVDRLSSLEAIDVIDFKAHYDFMAANQKLSKELYQKILTSFPDTYFEDPSQNDEFKDSLTPYRDKITWDAPLHSLKDIKQLPFRPKVINIKPSRFGSIKELFAVYEHCLENNIGMYAGGQFEIGHGREQAQYLASLFHPESPNDLAPSEYNSVKKDQKLPDAPIKVTAEF